MKRSKYMKILVPLDGSENANKALIHACDLAKNYQSFITIIYIAEKPTPLNLLDKKEYMKITKRFGKKILEKGKENALKRGLDAKAILKEGNVADEIVEYAKNDNTNLIIMGRKGLGKATRFLIGSVSSKLTNNSPCSLLIVK
ncbi:MAG: universal stress protein [Nitrosopumilaceae archaeon]|nr:universal stress protein [Nitrosopumilaceae archaeon]NIU00914.1 universal stress protein [Nitrosopumilaceae archaeon]NIU87367.1 universal stress protein [Nitrosopumilaceae archaeon]NIV65895.1 universal stress protein [Nitrosopumilaceae archaeon]NIX61516.1 universal stress protein [Nitrosopumilaceae archaeon]